MSQFFKNRVIITISDIKGTKSYSLSKLVRKFIFWIVVFIISVAIIGAIIIPVLTQKMMSLASQNEIYQRDLNSKIAAYDRLDDKFELLQERIIAYEESSNLPQRQPETCKCNKDGKPSKEKSVDMGTEIKNFLLKHIPNGYPIRHIEISSGFGYRIHPIFGTRILHRGVDFRAPIGTPVYSVADGIVTRVVRGDDGGYGKIVVIRHKYGFETAFAHLSDPRVEVGDIVHKGQLVALSGASGRITGSHLHFEIHYLGAAINPQAFFSWNMATYNKIFKQERNIPWDSLIKNLQK
jgi:murein DD-endopeptidase MepM/ murein hydrolase activator NlpD